MRWIIGILFGGGLGAFIGYLILPDLSILTALAGAYIGLKFTGRGRRTNHRDEGYWDGDQNSDWGDSDDNDDIGDDGGGND
jgi:hypothetical protein